MSNIQTYYHFKQDFQKVVQQGWMRYMKRDFRWPIAMYICTYIYNSLNGVSEDGVGFEGCGVQYTYELVMLWALKFSLNYTTFSVWLRYFIMTDKFYYPVAIYVGILVVPVPKTNSLLRVTHILRGKAVWCQDHNLFSELRYKITYELSLFRVHFLPNVNILSFQSTFVIENYLAPSHKE